jgi:PAS domain S-box-containing protein
VATDAVTYFSPAVRDILAREPEELLGQKWFDFVHPEDRDAVAAARRAVIGQPAAIEAVFRMMRGDGRYVWIEVHGRYIPGSVERSASVQSTWRDVTDRKTAEEEAVRLRKEADKANKAKSEFLAMMSHELRTPMAGVLGIADLLLLDDAAIDERRRLTKQLKRSALGLLDILNDILDFSKIEAGKLEIENEPFSLGDVLQDVRGLFGPAASAKGLVFEVTTGDGLPDGVKGDAKRLRQIMINLVNNAVKFTKQGRVDLRVEHKTIDDGHIVLCGSVKDTGIGMSAETAARLFQPFVQADSSTSRNFGGTGLGLTIARLLVSAMKGRIWVESELGRGATFFFVIPLATAADALTSTVRHDRRTPQTRSLRPLSILVAEDTDTVRQIIVMMLTRMSHVVDAVENGAAAVAKARAGVYDVVLMDMQMPVMDGIEATKAIRSMERAGERTPIIALTADAIHEHRERYFGAGVDAIITKPINWEDLVRKFAELVPDVAVPAIADRRKSDVPAPPVSLVNDTLLAELDAVMGSDGLGAFFKSFTDGLARYQGDIGTALADNDLARAKKAAHALKGLSSQMGADRIAAIAAAIEMKAISLDEAKDRLPALSGTVTETLLALASKYAWADVG